MSLISEQLEEGEIIDDEFEEISDNSITECTIGKFVSPNENLRALSLSSDSEIDYKKITIKPKKKLQHRKCKHSKKIKRRHIPSDSTDSDFSSDMSEDLSIKVKLKEAVHISQLEMGQKRSLEARLKAMNGLPIETVQTPIPSPPPPPNIRNSDESDKTEEKIDDSELEKLRLEALKTAFLKKNQQRKKRKALETQNDQQVKPSNDVLDNKENNTPEQTEKPTPDIEDDEDLLRASLLAGLAKKITKIPLAVESPVKPAASTVAVTQPKKPVQVQVKNLNVIKKIVQKPAVVPKSQVKPLIIKLNSDSDSTDDTMNDNGKISQINAISSTVEQFLKEQRAKFETETKQKNQNTPPQTQNKDILEKSAVKLLPKSQQIEYQQLLKRLKNAEKQNKLKKLHQKTSATTVAIAPAKPPTPPPNEARIPKTNELDGEIQAVKNQIEAEKKRPGLGNELTTLRRTLREVRIQRNGSLQIKPKYQVLTPIIKKITEASQERRKHEERIKYLLQQLNESRNCLTKSHQQFSTLVKELVNKKQLIDKSVEKNPTLTPNKINTVNKLNQATKNVVITTNQLKSISETKNNLVNKIPPVPIITSTPVKCCERAPSPMEESSIANSQNNDYEDMDVCNSDETDISHIDIVDPNDIDQIFKRRPAAPPPPPPPPKSTIPEYVSPLNINTNRYGNLDPLAIMCPYEVNGSCRDRDCTFKHYLKHQN